IKELKPRAVIVDPITNRFWLFLRWSANYPSRPHLIQEGDVRQLYNHIIDAATSIMRSDFATMQMIDPTGESLRLLVHRGFTDAFAKSFQQVRSDASTAC